MQQAIPSGKLMQLWWFFLKAGALVFGSGLAIVPADDLGDAARKIVAEVQKAA